MYPCADELEKRYSNDDYILIGITNLKYFEICNRHNVYSVPQK